MHMERSNVNKGRGGCSNRRLREADENGACIGELSCDRCCKVQQLGLPGARIRYCWPRVDHCNDVIVHRRGFVVEMLEFVDLAEASPARAPWGGTDKDLKPLVRLHNEILRFCDLVLLTDEEKDARKAAIRTVTESVATLYPKARVQVFGSEVTGLCLPSSDVDVVVHGATGNKLRAVAGELAKRGAASIEVVDSARIPIVKCRLDGVAVDVSFDTESGLRTARVINDFLAAMPALRPLTLVVKCFLQQRELNETYSGGIGSFATQLMLVSFLQHRHRTDQATSTESAPNLGSLLLEFFELYGRDYNYSRTCISVRRNGSYVDKKSKGFFNPSRPNLLAIENPDEPEMDVGKNSYNIHRVKRAFDFAYVAILRAANRRHDSVLAAAIDPGDPGLSARSCRGLFKVRDFLPSPKKKKRPRDDDHRKPPTKKHHSSSSDKPHSSHRPHHHSAHKHRFSSPPRKPSSRGPTTKFDPHRRHKHRSSIP